MHVVEIDCSFQGQTEYIFVIMCILGLSQHGALQKCISYCKKVYSYEMFSKNKSDEDIFAYAH